ncbi:hypothetical protein GCM10027447_25270 [Glycomyces halotolerans]
MSDRTERPGPPAPVAEDRSGEQPIVAEPREPEPPLESVPVAPVQIAPEPGAAPVAAVPEASSSEPEPPRREEDTAPSDELSSKSSEEEPPHTDDTLGLPPAVAVDPPNSTPSEDRSGLQGIPVPFATPPTERNSGRFATALTLGIVGGVVLVIGVGVAFFAAATIFANSYLDKIEATAEEFMADISEERWEEAHAGLCPDLREDPVDRYIDEWSEWDADDAEVLTVRDRPDGIHVPVRLGDGSTVELLMTVDEDAQSLETSVCGWERTD